MDWSISDWFGRSLRREERLTKIARLEHLRDRALAEAPVNRWSFRGITLAVLAGSGFGVMRLIAAPTDDGVAAVAFVGAIFVMSLCFFWRSFVMEPRGLDPWELSDFYPSEEGSARHLQAKIDALRQPSGPWG